MNKLSIKKILIFISIPFLSFLAYRLYQLNIYLEEHKNDKVPEVDSVFIGKESPQVSIDVPEDYVNRILKDKAIKYQQGDTVVLQANKLEAVEVEVYGKLNFSDIEIIKDPSSASYDYRNGKPWMNKKNTSYFLSSDKALWMFKPYLYGENVKVELKHGGDKKFTIYFRNLEWDDYQNYILSKLSVKRQAECRLLIEKYKRDLERLVFLEVHTSRRSSTTGLNYDKFFSGNPGFKKGNYSNEYIKQDGKYKTSILTGTNQKILVEPINQEL